MVTEWGGDPDGKAKGHCGFTTAGCDVSAIVDNKLLFRRNRQSRGGSRWKKGEQK